MDPIEFRIAMMLAKADIPFSALLGAAMARADSSNMELLKTAFPQLAADLQEHYDAPGGLTQAERDSSSVPPETMHERVHAIARNYVQRIID